MNASIKVGHSSPLEGSFRHEEGQNSVDYKGCRHCIGTHSPVVGLDELASNEWANAHPRHKGKVEEGCSSNPLVNIPEHHAVSVEILNEGAYLPYVCN